MLRLTWLTCKKEEVGDAPLPCNSSPLSCPFLPFLPATKRPPVIPGRKRILVYFALENRTWRQHSWLFIIAWSGAFWNMSADFTNARRKKKPAVSERSVGTTFRRSKKQQNIVPAPSKSIEALLAGKSHSVAKEIVHAAEFIAPEMKLSPSRIYKSISRYLPFTAAAAIASCIEQLTAFWENSAESPLMKWFYSSLRVNVGYTCLTIWPWSMRSKQIRNCIAWFCNKPFLHETVSN